MSPGVGCKDLMMADISLTHFAFTPRDLQALREEERVFLVQGAGLLQEITSLRKFAYMSSHGVSERWVRAAQNAQAMYFCRLLAGSLFEGWETLHKDRYRTVRAKYRPTLDQTSLAAYDRLESYFAAKENLCKRVRNQLSHHHNYGEIRSTLRQWPHDHNLDVLISDNHANCAWLVNDLLTNFALLGVQNPGSAIEQFFQETFSVANDFLEAVGALVSKILIEVIEGAGLKGTEETIHGAPALSETRLYYFMSEDKDPTSA